MRGEWLRAGDGSSGSLESGMLTGGGAGQVDGAQYPREWDPVLGGESSGKNMVLSGKT